MTKRIASLVLAIVMVFQTLVPQISIAKEEVKPPKDNLVKVGVINSKSYDSKLMLELNRQTAKNRVNKSANSGTRLFGYFEEGQEPEDADKLKYHGEVKADLTVKGLDGNPFQWNEVFGREEVHLRFMQINDETGAETGIERVLNVNQAGKYTWTDGDGNPAELPLFNNKLEPLIYEVKLDEEVSDRVKLLTARLTTTGTAGSPTFDRPDADGRIKYHLTLEIGLQQVASSKFVSEWHTAVDEAERPQLVGTMTGSMGNGKSKTISFNLPINDNDKVIVRTASRRDKNKLTPEFLYKTPKVKLVDTNANGLTFDTSNKTVKDSKNKYKYEFKYDVIKGGKLTMTEIIPVIFEANGGKFENVTAPDTETKITKEVEYDKSLTDVPADPKKDLETFKGWSETQNGTALSDEDFKAAIKNIKNQKTFYAIWNNNPITAEELTVHESFNDGTGYVNDFIPTLETLKKQVKIKDASGTPKALTNDDEFAIVNGTNEYKTDAQAKDYLYGLLKEKDNNNDEPTRVETVKAKVTHKNGTSQTVDIPIKVIKNIYEAKTLTERPYYVPSDYVKVTVNPTDKAKNPQKTYYYVNKEAQVVIPGENPEGKGDNKFVKWTYLENGTETEYKLADKPRHMFKAETTIKAQYVSDVIEQNGPNKPDTVPSNFVEVKFVPTNNATDETKAEKIFWVNPDKEVTIPVKNPVGKQYFTFKEWKIGVNADGAAYTPSTPTKFTDKNGTTITATYDEAKNIIPYNPNEPKTRPDGYVRVTFAADQGLKLTEQKAYYVKKNANIILKAIKDDTTNYGYPNYKEETGYKFDKWDKEDSLVIEATDIVVTAKATKLDKVIPEKDKNNNPNTKPEGYKEVTFVIKAEDKTKGSITGVAKFYVNPTEYVTINPPSTKAETGYVFGAWDKDTTIPTVYDKDTTITGSFNDLEAVIPKINPDGTENKQPAGFKKVEFVIDPATGGKIADKEITVYYVNPAKDVTIPQPKTKADTGYEFDQWKIEDQEFTNEAKKYIKDTTVKGNFKKLPDIIPEKTGNTTNAKPVGYVTVTFDKGEHGKEIKGQTVYYVNPKADPVKTLAEITKKPTVTPETGYKFTGWDTKDDFEIKDTKTVIAQYESIDDVIPKTKNDDSEKPDGYITVTFKTTDKAGSVEKVVYINPNKAVELKDQAPKVNPITGYEFAGWDRPIKERIQYKDGDVITAQFNEIGNVSKVQKPGYVKVKFKQGDHGTLTGDINLWIKPDTDVTIPAPSVKPNVGYKFDKWDKSLTVKLAAGSPTYEITAGYTELKNIIPQEKTDGSDRPEGYHTVVFKAVNGNLEGKTVYYVKPNVDIDLTNTANGITKKANVGFTDEGVNWSPEITSKKYTANAEYTFTFVPLADVIEEKTGITKPDGYVKVKVVPTDKATDNNEKTYFVNPNKEVTIPFTKPTGKDVTVDVNNPKAFKWIFTKWTSDETPFRTWTDDIKAKFTNENTIITAHYEKSITDQGSVVAEEVTVHESFKDANGWVNNFLPKEDDFKKAIKVTDKNGSHKDLPNDAQVEFILGEKEPNQKYQSLEEELYDKLQEKDDGNNPSRIEKIEAKVTFNNGEVQNVEIPIKVIKNIYEAKTKEGKPFYVPNNYVKVTLDPTTKAKDPQKTYYYVNPDAQVVIPGENPTGIGNNKFVKWTIPGTPEPTEYNLKERKQFMGETTITATYTEAKNIIPYDPVKDPTTRPDGFARVTFVAENGLNLENVKHYYVKKNAGITLGNAELVKPGVKAETGYEFINWDPADTTEIKDTDIVVKAKSKELESFIPADGNTKPEGYVTVTFVAEENGSLKGVQKYYVNPTKYVAFNPPEAIGNTGYEFATWSQNSTQKTNYTKDTTIKATFTQIGAVSLVEKPGYTKVKFEIKGEGGSILNGQTTTYYVDPNRDVTLKAPVTSADTGYEFNFWSPNPTTGQKYKEPKTIEGTFKKLKDIIPATDDQGNANTKPDGYVTLTFKKGNGGKSITGQTIYYVNPKADPAKTLAEITKPNVTPDTGYEFEKWDTEDSFQIKADKTVTATYTELRSISDTEIEGYVKVTFDTTSKGVIEGTTNTEKIVYVNPNKPVVLNGHEPKITPKANNVFARWNVNLEKETFFKDGDRITAQYYDKNNISVTEIPGFVKVKFDNGDHGNLSGTQAYWVKPGVDVTVPAPTVNPNTGYEFNNWNHALTVNLPANSATYTIKAEYKSLEDIIEGDKIKPNGYLKVEFVSDGNGKLIGTKLYYVNPNKNVDLTSKADAIFKNPNVGYTEIDGNWSNENSKKLKDTFSADATFKYNFKELPDVDTTNHPGYVKVEFIAGENGQIVDGNKTYYVNPNKNIKVGSNKLPIPEPSADKNYVFDKWFTGIDKTNPVTSDRTYIALFKPSKVTLTYVADDKTSGTVPAELTYDIGTEITLAGGNDLKKDNYVLTGWKIGDKVYKPGEKFTINDNITATAVWDTDFHTVEFDTDGAGHIPAQKVKHGDKITKVDNPQKDGYFFIGWKIKGTNDTFDPTKDKVTEDITLVAQYSKDVIEQTDPNTKPNVPKNFVEVKFVPTDKAKDATVKIYWVNPEKAVTIPVNNPVAKPGFMFKEWKIGDVKTGETYTAGSPKQFTEQVTTITATYNESENIKPFDPKAENPMVRPDGYVRVTFDADLGLKLTESKAYYVKKNADVKLSQLPKPTYDKAKGYVFDKWDKDDTFEIKDSDIVVTAKARLLPEPECKGGGVVYVPSITPKDSGKRADVDRSAKYLEVKYMQGHDNMFMPYKSLSRAEAAQILANALISDGYKYLDIDANTYYSDLKPNAWYLKAVSIVTQAGVFEGFGGKFMPDRSITQGEWIATLVRFQMQGKMKGNAMRVNERHWAKEEVQSAYSVGWLKIYTDGTMPFNVDKAITREEVAAVTNRAFNRVRDFEYELKNENRLYNFKDISRDMWSYYDILCATNTFVHNKKNYLSHEIDYRKYTADYKYEDLIVDHFQRVLRQKNN